VPGCSAFAACELEVTSSCVAVYEVMCFMRKYGFAVMYDWLLNICVAVTAIVLCLMLVEVSFRFISFREELSTSHAFQNLGQEGNFSDLTLNVPLRQIIRRSENPRIIYELIPNISVMFQNKPLSINSHGFRGLEYHGFQSEKTIRIVGLGDSFMFGWGVNYDESYLDLLSQYLNTSVTDGYRWEVINTAVPGYNTAMEVETLREKGLRYNPDLVIIGYVENDLDLPNFLWKAENYFSLKKSFAIDFFSSRLREQHRGFHDGLIAAPLRGYEYPYLRFETDPSRVPEQYKDLVGIDAYRSSMIELKSLSIKHNFQVVVFTHMYIPAPLKGITRDLGFSILEAGAVVNEFLANHGMQEYLASPLTVSNVDPHPSALGHAILAEVLHSYLRDSGMLRQILQRRGVL
jgi:hypothetical protein